MVSDRHLMLLDRLGIEYKVVDLNSVGKGKVPLVKPYPFEQADLNKEVIIHEINPHRIA